MKARLAQLWRRLGLRRRLADDRGSLSMAMILWTPVVILLTAFVVDMGYLMSQREHAADLADQAARRVADDLDVTALRSDPPYYAVNRDPGGGCLTDARNYLAASGVDPGTAVVTDCTVSPPRGGAANPTAVTVKVTVKLTYKPLFAGFVIPGSITVTGDGTAHPATG